MIDPNDTNFNINEFKLTDYNPDYIDGDLGLSSVLQTLFPEGTSQENIDAFFVERLEAFSTHEYALSDDKTWVERSPDDNYTKVYYVPDDLEKAMNENRPWMYTPGWEIWVEFNSDSKLTAIKADRIGTKHSFVQVMYFSENKANYRGDK